MLRMGILLGATGSHSYQECWEQALNYWHYLNGLNAMNMLYQTNMADFGGEHSVFQAYHSWFCYGSSLYDGKPAAVDEVFYPYYAADSQVSVHGTSPGHVVGGPNRYYSGNQTPPANQVYYHRFYRDWHYEDTGQRRSWEVNETAIYYTGSYLCLGSFFMLPGETGIETNTNMTAVGPALSIFPNPARESFLIDYYLQHTGEIKIELYDISGRRIYTETYCQQSVGHHKAVLLTNNIAAGIYFVRLTETKTKSCEITEITIIK
jgi:hypothetical protein